MSKVLIQILKTGSCSAMKVKPKGSKKSTLKLLHFQNRHHKKMFSKPSFNGHRENIVKNTRAKFEMP